MTREQIMKKHNISNILLCHHKHKRLTPEEDKEFEEFVKTLEKYMRVNKIYRLTVWRK